MPQNRVLDYTQFTPSALRNPTNNDYQSYQDDIASDELRDTVECQMDSTQDDFGELTGQQLLLLAAHDQGLRMSADEYLEVLHFLQ